MVAIIQLVGPMWSKRNYTSWSQPVMIELKHRTMSKKYSLLIKNSFSVLLPSGFPYY